MPATRCPVCRTGPQRCLPGCSLCKTCWKLSKECQCQSADQEPLSRIISSGSPASQSSSASAPTPPSVTADQIPSKMATASIMKEPPNYATVRGDRKNLTQYIAALKLWAKVSGVEKKNQADYVKYHAFQTVPAYFEELDVKFCDSLENKEDGLTDIINLLKQKFGVSQHSEIVHKLKDSYTTVLKYSLFIVGRLK